MKILIPISPSWAGIALTLKATLILQILDSEEAALEKIVDQYMSALSSQHKKTKQR